MGAGRQIAVVDGKMGCLVGGIRGEMKGGRKKRWEQQRRGRKERGREDADVREWVRRGGGDKETRLKGEGRGSLKYMKAI